MSTDDRIERSRLGRKVCAVAAAACALGLTSLVVRHDGSYLPSALSQFYGPGGLTEAGPVTAGAEAGARQAYQAYQANRLASAQKHQVLAHVCFGNNCADVSPAFVKALIRTEKKTYAKAYTSGEAAERRELVAAKPHQVGDVIEGVRPMRVATLREQVGRHEQEVHGPADEVKAAKPLWHSQWMKLFGPKGNGKVNYGQW